MNYKKIYNHVYNAKPEYSAPSNSPAVRYWPHAMLLCKKNGDEPSLKSVLDVGGGQGGLASLIIDSCGAYSILDVSTTALAKAGTAFPEAMRIEYDITRYNRTDLMSYETVACFDVLEHIVESDMDAALGFLRRSGNRCVGSISMRESDGKDYNGNGLHVTVRDQDWWTIKLRKFWNEVFTEVIDGDTLIFLGRF